MQLGRVGITDAFTGQTDRYMSSGGQAAGDGGNELVLQQPSQWDAGLRDASLYDVRWLVCYFSFPRLARFAGCFLENPRRARR